MDMALALFLSAPISLQMTHQGKGWALYRLSPSTLYAFWSLWHTAGTATMGLLPQLELGCPYLNRTLMSLTASH